MSRWMVFMVTFSIVQGCSKDFVPGAQKYDWSYYYEPFTNNYYVSSLARDEGGNIWIASHVDSVIRIADRTTNLLTTIDLPEQMDSSAHLVLENERMKLWSKDGVFILFYKPAARPRRTTICHVFPMDSHHSSAGLIRDSENRIWWATHEGLYLYDQDSTTRFDRTNSSIPASHISWVCEDSFGQIYVGTVPDSGTKGVVLKYDGGTWRVWQEAEVPGAWFSKLVFQGDTYWLGSLYRPNQDGGLGLYKGVASSAYLRQYHTDNSGIAGNSVVDISIDDNQVLWLGTYSGLCSFDGSEWKTYLDRKTHNNMEWVIADDPDYVWTAVQYTGLSRLKKPE